MNKFFCPRLKPFVEYCFKDGVVYFFAQPGNAIEIEDPTHFIFSVCKTMDGQKNVIQLKGTLQPDFPEEFKHLDDLLLILDNEGLIEDVEINKNTNLTDYDKNRLSRNIEFFGAYTRACDNKYLHQEKLNSMKVAILGLGGVGSNVLLNLAALGVSNFNIADFDMVELSNLNRQIIYTQDDIGKLKTKAAKHAILKFLPKAKVEIFSLKISSIEDIEKIIANQDFVIHAADQPREKIMDWLNIACVRKNIPFMCGALDHRYAINYTIVPKKTGCIDCWKQNARNKGFIFQDFIKSSEFILAPSPNIAIMPFLSIISGLISMDFLKLATGIGEAKSLGKLCSFDFINMEFSILESWQRDPNCNTCGDAFLNEKVCVAT